MAHSFRQFCRRGSVLFLAIALLALLAVIGILYLSTASSERGTSQQNTVNAEADLLLQGLTVALNSSITVDGCVRVNAAGIPGYPQTYRSASQEMAYPPSPAGSSMFGLGDVDGFGNLATGPSGVAVPHDLFLADRIPTLTDSTTNTAAAGDVPVNWAAVSWPLFADPAGNYVFDSPFENGAELPVNTLGGVNRSQLRFFPTTKTENGKTYPGLLVYLPANKSIVDSAGNTVMTGPGYLTPTGFHSQPLTGGVSSPQYNSYSVFAADADGDGIADAPLWKLSIGPLDGITYYAAIRVVDNNAAFNASTAWDNQTDVGSALSVGGTTYNAAYLASQGLPASYLNYGFFRSNIGLLQALNPTSSTPTANQEMTAVNEYRFTGTIASPVTASAVTLNMGAYDDQMNLRSDFTFGSAGDLIDSQLARRGDNAGYANSNLGIKRMSWLGFQESAVMARRFCLADRNFAPSLLETLLPNETTSSTMSDTPYFAGQLYSPSSAAGFWYNDQFAPQTTSITPYSVYPSRLRSLLVGSNAQSNDIPSWFGNSDSVPSYSPGAVYAFGDMVRGSDGFTYVSLVSANNTAKLTAAGALPIDAGSTTLTTNAQISIGQTTPAIYENPFWARVPWSTLPLKASVNTATFEQLWLAFCHVMTDSLSPPTATTALQWTPPQTTPGAANSLGTYAAGDAERQLAMFRSSVRDNRAAAGAGLILSPMQQMQLRAGLAAVNAIDMRDGDDDVTSRHIVLDDATGAPTYDVELFGTEKQPYVLEVLADVQDDGTPAAEKNYVEIELVNPYPTPIIMTPSWHIAYLTRSAAANGSATMKLNDIGPLNSTVIIPPAQGNRPGLAYLTSVTTATSSGSTIHTPTNLDPPVTQVIVQNAAGSLSISANNVGTVTGLESGLKGELVILKPRLAATPDRMQNTQNFPNGDRSISTDPTDPYDEVHSFQDLIPVDQVDFTGALSVSDKSFPYRLHYRRAAKPQASESYAWNFVYPGPYYNQATGAAAGSNGTGIRHTSPPDANYTLRLAFQIEQETANIANPDLGDFNDLPAGEPSADVSTTPTYFTAPIQLNNVNMAGPNSTFTAPPPARVSPLTCTLASVTKVNQFPFGGFARNGDLMQIPFIGAYRILLWHSSDSSAIVEMNSVSMDSACAWDCTLAAANAGINTGGSGVSIDDTTQSVQLNPITGNWELPPEGATVNQPDVSPPGDTQSVTATGAHFFEQIGRMCPVGDSGAAGPASDDFVEPIATTPNVTQNWHCHWARRLFDYLTVDAPHDDYFPNVDPRPALNTSTPAIGPRYPLSDPVLVSAPTTEPSPVANRNPAIANAQVSATGQAAGTEETVGVEGLVNINTAPLCVLAQVPFVPRGTDNITYLPATIAGTLGKAAGSQNNPDDTNTSLTLATPLTPRDDNTDLAQAIIDYRIANGPFKSLIDLYKVPAFALENQLLWQTAKEPNALQGYFIAARPAYNSSGLQDWTKAGSDSPRYDFAERFLLLNHISNLLTIHSDSFTCYLLLQGWRGVGTSNPTLAVQRRAAFILDRTNVTAANPTANMFRVLTH